MTVSPRHLMTVWLRLLTDSCRNHVKISLKRTAPGYPTAANPLPSTMASVFFCEMDLAKTLPQSRWNHWNGPLQLFLFFFCWVRPILLVWGLIKTIVLQFFLWDFGFQLWVPTTYLRSILRNLPRCSDSQFDSSLRWSIRGQLANLQETSSKSNMVCCFDPLFLLMKNSSFLRPMDQKLLLCVVCLGKHMFDVKQW